MAVSIPFRGWFQARLATDPDDFDEPRGQNGWTFAFEGEPDLDRIIRLSIRWRHALTGRSLV